MKISVCIPTWEQYGNGFYYLKSLFESLKKQTFKNFDLIIYDNCSTDKTLSICKKYQKKHNIKSLLNILRPGCTIIETNNTANETTDISNIPSILIPPDFDQTNTLSQDQLLPSNLNTYIDTTLGTTLGTTLDATLNTIDTSASQVFSSL